MQIQPSDLKIKTISESKTEGVFEFDPLPKGFGHTIGNTLRRVILTSLPGAAITQIKVDGANHQFSTIEGVKEDLIEIILNLKKIRIKKHSQNPEVATIKVEGPGEVTGKDIETTSDLEVINKNQHIATLANKKTKLEIELIVENGVGYSPMEERQSSKIGVIVLDALFSPVQNATMEIEETRFGGKTDLDKLRMKITTDGSIKPSTAIYNSAAILTQFFDKLAKWEIAEEKEEVAEITSTGETHHIDEIAVDELPLQTRTVNALKKAGIDTLAQLSKKTAEDLADIKNLGEKSITEINKLLEKEGLRD